VSAITLAFAFGSSPAIGSAKRSPDLHSRLLAPLDIYPDPELDETLDRRRGVEDALGVVEAWCDRRAPAEPEEALERQGRAVGADPRMNVVVSERNAQRGEGAVRGRALQLDDDLRGILLRARCSSNSSRKKPRPRRFAR
jgi:hypothetical protein